MIPSSYGICTKNAMFIAARKNYLVATSAQRENPFGFSLLSRRFAAPPREKRENFNYLLAQVHYLK